jgi:hypothetical protein
MGNLNYYLVLCKHGHVGRNKYLPIAIPVKANSLKEAAQLAKTRGGVKRHHIDWCLDKPKLINENEYQTALYYYNNDLYWNKITRSKLHLFEDRLVEEVNYSRINKRKSNKKIFIKKKKDCSSWFIEKKMKLMSSF